MSSIGGNLQGGQSIQMVMARLNAAIARRSAHFGGSVSLVAVSKNRPVADIRRAFAGGLRLFGENYVQEAIDKIALLADLRGNHPSGGIQWHLIGPLQSNKAKLASTYFDWVQSVDRQKIADALNQHRGIEVEPLNVLVQVNISGEMSKSGAAVDVVLPLAKHIAALPRLNLRGLMAIVENVSEEAILRKQFQQMRRLFDEVKSCYPQADTLSMGMSQDYTVAIDEGATMIRVGSAIFGARDAKGAS